MLVQRILVPKKCIEIQIIILKFLFSDYFINLGDFPWNDDALIREWVCSKVKQSYCDQECRNEIKSLNCDCDPPPPPTYLTSWFR